MAKKLDREIHVQSRPVDEERKQPKSIEHAWKLRRRGKTHPSVEITLGTLAIPFRKNPEHQQKRKWRPIKKLTRRSAPEEPVTTQEPGILPGNSGTWKNRGGPIDKIARLYVRTIRFVQTTVIRSKQHDENSAWTLLSDRYWKIRTTANPDLIELQRCTEDYDFNQIA